MASEYGATIAGMNIGARIETHPATDAWISGDRYGTIESVTGAGFVWVRMDRSGRMRKFDPDNVRLI